MNIDKVEGAKQRKINKENNPFDKALEELKEYKEDLPTVPLEEYEY